MSRAVAVRSRAATAFFPDKRLRFRNLDLDKRKLAFFLEQKVPQVKFVDRTFNCKKDHAMAI